MTQTDNLSLPYILSSQAQKHVTHNEALLALDAILHLNVLSRTTVGEPSTPNPGDRYLIPTGASGEFALHEGKLAAFQDGVFQYYTPTAGWLAFVADEALWIYFDGTDWQLLEAPLSETIDKIGINTSADLINRFALASDASLFTHNGTGHRLNINKATATDTGSLIFQTNYSARAEFGLAGDDQFRIKTSPDGSNFYQALTTNAANGHISIGDISPSASQLNVANQLGVSDTVSSDAIELSATAGRTTLYSTPTDGELEIAQNGDGSINFKIDSLNALKLESGKITSNAPMLLATYPKTALPNASPEGQLIFVPDADGGSCLAFSDGTNWRRAEDRSSIL